MHLWWGWGGELLLDSASMRSSDLSDSNNRIKNTNTNWIQSIFKPAYFGRLPLCWQYEYSSIQIGVFGILYSSICTNMSIAAHKYKLNSNHSQTCSKVCTLTPEVTSATDIRCEPGTCLPWTMRRTSPSRRSSSRSCGCADVLVSTLPIPSLPFPSASDVHRAEVRQAGGVHCTCWRPRWCRSSGWGTTISPFVHRPDGNTKMKFISRNWKSDQVTASIFTPVRNAFTFRM